MKAVKLRYMLVGVGMLMASMLAIALTPTKLLVSKDQVPDLEKVVPRDFGNWRAVENRQILVNPSQNKQQEALASMIYDRTVMRTYVDTQGNSIMVAIAYGSQQGGGLNMHRPELCYPSQGFEIGASQYSSMTVQGRSFPITQLIAKQGARIEPITYWIRIGDEVVRSQLGVRAALLKAGWGGYIPDGMLVRVSNITSPGRSVEPFYDIQKTFLNEFISALDAEGKRLLLGDLYKR